MKKMKHRSLVSQFIFTLILIFLSTILTSLLTYLLGAAVFVYGLNSGKLFPADHYEAQIPAIEAYVEENGKDGFSSLEKEELDRLVYGDGFFYQAADRDGNRLYGTYDREIFASREEMYQMFNTTFPADGYYVHVIPVITDTGIIDGTVSLIYSLHLSSVNSNAYIGIALIFMVCSPFLYMILFTFLFAKNFAKGISKPLQTLMNGAKQIKNKNLDFEIDYHANNELGELCDSFRAMQAELGKSLSRQWAMEQERTQTVEALAHDLKSPLSIVKAYTETLADDTAVNEEQTEYLSVIEENIEKSISLVNQMQYTTELNAPNVTVEISPVRLTAFLLKKKRDYEFQAREKHIGISLEMQTDLPEPVFTDVNKLERILNNVVANSLEYTPVGGQIKIDVRYDETYIFYSVSDTGEGFRPRDLDKAMERFYRGDEARSSKGSHMGLGLYIVRQLSGLLGGFAEIENGPDGGARVRFCHTYKG